MSKKLVLIVDDEVLIRETISELIEFEGYESIKAESGEDALNHLESAERMPDLILLDLMMPEMTGTEFMIRMKKKEDFSHIPIVLISAAHDARSIARDFGVDLVRKPLDADLLLKEMARNIGGHQEK